MEEAAKPIEQPTMVQDAHAAAARLKAENERLEKNIAQLQELKAFETLGGKSLGAPPVAPVVIETAKDYAKRVLEGGVQYK